MARTRKSGVVDGFNVYKAAQRAVQEDGAQPPSGKLPDGAEEKPEPHERKIGSHIGRTVLPTKHEVSCYECGYEFALTGAVKSTFCSKCRAKLSVENVVINRAWAEDVKTAGTVHVKPDGVVTSGELVANHVILEGQVTGGHIRVFRWLELRSAAGYQPQRLEAQRLRIGADTHLILPEVRYEQVEVLGTLKARIEAGARLVVKPGGRVEGDVRTPEVQVEEGGTLVASLDVRPSRAIPVAHAVADDAPLGRTA